MSAPDSVSLFLVIGDQAWPFPIPLVKSGERWRFATEQGEDELVNRRIGANERSAINVLNAYLDAQKEYAEARITAAIVDGSEIPGPDDLGILADRCLFGGAVRLAVRMGVRFLFLDQVGEHG